MTVDYLNTSGGRLKIDIGEERRRLPLVLAGPILRRTLRNSVTVWIALQRPREVWLRVYDSGANLVMQGDRKTERLGEFLHVVAVEATPSEAPSGEQLRPGEVYQYNLEFQGSGPDVTLNDDGVVNTAHYETDLTYGSYERPSFVFPSGNLGNIRFVHGSCRKPHGEGHDALPAVDRMIESTYDTPTSRPQQLFLTGDQIYADDVADALLALLTDAANSLLGWEESFEFEVDGSPSTTVLSNPDMLSGERQSIAENQCKFSSGHAKSHLMGLGEYYAMYLFAWSDVLWPSESAITNHVLPDIPRVLAEDEEPSEHGETNRLLTFLDGLGQVRRALANIPTYMIFDDHEVTDDWYLHEKWCGDVLDSHIGEQVLQNALSAYAVFQAWGNAPEQFSPGAPGETLLEALSTVTDSSGRTSDGLIDVDSGLLRIPSVSGGALDWSSSDDQLEWHYSLDFDAHEVIVLDTRTHRGFPDDPRDAPRLIDNPSFDIQFPAPRDDVDVSVVVSPCPPLDPPTMAVAQDALMQRADRASADWEHWHLHHEALERLFAHIARRRTNTDAVVLSGDVHFGYTIRTHHVGHHLLGASDSTHSLTVIANLTASASKNENWKTKSLHNVGYHVDPESLVDSAPRGISPVQIGPAVARFVVQTEVPPTVFRLGWRSSDPSNPSREKEFQNVLNTTLKVERDPLLVEFRLSDVSAVEEAMEDLEEEGVDISLDWAHRSDYLIDTRTPAPAGSSTGGSSIDVPAPGTDRTEALGRYLARAHDWDVRMYNRQMQDIRGKVTHGGAGKDAVGRNNVGEVWFDRNDDGKRVVVHEFWWRMNGKGGGMLHPFPLTRHVVSLDQFDFDYLSFSEAPTGGG